MARTKELHMREVRVKARVTNAMDDALARRGSMSREEALVIGDEVLIGQTVPEKLELMVDCAARRLIPNPAHPDQHDRGGKTKYSRD